jgi:hypothetical protein
MSSILSLKDKNDDLVVIPGDLAIVACPWGTAEIPDSLTTGADGALNALPVGWQSVGEIEKKSGAEISPDSKTADIEGYGSLVPRRTVKTAESVMLDFTAQEVRKINFGMFWGMDLSDIQANETTGEWRAIKRATTTVQFWSIMLFGIDGPEDNEVIPFWIFPKMSVVKSGKISLQMDGALSTPISLSAYEDNDFGGYVAFGMAGKGNQTLNQSNGFGETVGTVVKHVAITGGPTGGTFTITVDSKVTSAIPFNASRFQVKSALEGLSNVGENGVNVAGNATDGYDLDFFVPVTTVTATASFTGGTSPAIAVS